MPTPFENMLLHLSEIAKEKQNQTPCCPTCGECVCIIKHGFYMRYLFEDFEMIAIQRYRCDNPLCHRITFSNLPHPFLPFIRLPLCALKAMLKMVQDYKMTIAAVARSCKMRWRRVYRVLHTARQLFNWIKKEAAAALWGPSACLDPNRYWIEFTRAISYAFYPRRC